MSDEYQIDIPPSFISLFVNPGTGKLNATRDEVAARYELCDDMATMLTETAQTMQFSLGITEDDVLQRMERGLLGDASVVLPDEAQWVLSRLAELLNWRRPMTSASPGSQ
jgi:hypothetical protein